MNLLDLLRSRGLTPVHVSGAKGGEWASPCPLCGGKDRFHSFPEQEGGPLCQEAGTPGTFWCRKCGAAGDLLEYLTSVENMGFGDACQDLKVQRKARPLTLPKPPKSALPPAFVPQAWPLPSDIWRERAARLADKCHKRLVSEPNKALDWLAARGLDLVAVRRYRLGYLVEEPSKRGPSTGIFRNRKAWGLEPQEKKNPDGTLTVKHSLWIPRGIVIPDYVPDGYTEGALPLRIRIRRPDKDVAGTDFPKYHVIPGSGMAPLLLGAAARAFVVVEAELDAMLVHHLAGDRVGALAVLTNRGKPDVAAHAALSRAFTTLVALDYDKAGAEGWAWWQDNCPTARRWPVPAGKDPGDAFKAGEDLRTWVLAGLPPVLRAAALQTPAPQGPAISPAPAPAPAPTLSVGAQPEPLGPSLAGEAAPQGEGAQARQPQATPHTLARPSAPAMTRELRQQLVRLAACMRRHAVEFRSGSWRTPGHLTDAQEATLWADLLPLLTPEVDQLLRAHPAELVTAENLSQPL
ncbi:MAG: DNA primase [Proteobacteria bacterium]|nr:DNA primase [Pseudomonadota bacterium]MBU1594238.1 DNA primase [Pseudomonadota bacterium]